MGSELARLDLARRAIEKAASVDEAKSIRDKAEALRIYARQSGESLVIQNRCAEIKIRAERRAGEILARMEKHRGAGTKRARFREGTALKLSDLGISKQQSHRWQKMASIPEVELESFIAKLTSEKRELTSISVLRFAWEIERQSRESSTAETPFYHPLRSLIGKKVFSTVVVSPPWEAFEGGLPTGRGETPLQFSPDQLVTLPVSELTASDAHLYLWVTNKTLRNGFRCAESWGFRYRTCLTWLKPILGKGHYFRSSTEHVLFCVKGSLELARHDLGTGFQWPAESPRGEKPQEFFELVKDCSPSPYAVLFSKVRLDGWFCWTSG